MDANFIKETVFKTVEFEYDKEIMFYDFDGIKVEYDGNIAKIGANSEASLARGCFLFAMNISEGKTEFSIFEKRHFNDLSFFLDCSRNGVMKVESVKKYIDIIASLGFNMLFLYTEDTYRIEGRPRFGYLRGGYSVSEIQDMAEYGERMGVELVPCIQTLGHMTQYLKWSDSGGPDYTGEKISSIRGTRDVLMCGEEATYQFIEDAIKTLRKAYKTNRIHIGMDEAFGVGLGRYLAKHGLENKFDIMKKHLDIVVQICEKYGFRPMIWSDMFFRLGAGGYYRYNFDFPEGLRDSIPDVDIVYWDYYHDRTDMYDNMFNKHYELSDNVSFAGAIATWLGFLTAHEYSYRNSVAALKSCLKNKVKTVIATTWGDDGNEANAFFARPLLSVYSEYCYKGTSCTDEDIRKASEFLTKIKFEDAKELGNLSFIKPNPYLDEWRAQNGGGSDLLLGKRLFYGDVLYDMSVRVDSCDEIIKVYDSCASKMESLYKKGDKNKEDYYYAFLLYKICSMKAEFVKNLRKSYKNGDREYLKKVRYEGLPQLKKWYEEFAVCHKKQWYRDYKPFGYEVLSFRFGGVIRRVEDAIEILDTYLMNKVTKIDELEEEICIVEETYQAPVPELVTPSGAL